MDATEHNKPDTNEPNDSLENDTSVASSGLSLQDDSLEKEPGNKDNVTPISPLAKKPKNKFARFMRNHVNMYMWLFILVIFSAAGITIGTALTQGEKKEPTPSSTTLSDASLKQLANTDATVGDPKQLLSIQSNAVFAGKVLIRDSLDVAGQINVGGALSLPGITVSGDSRFDTVQVGRSLTIGGDTSIQGQLNVRRNITSNGSGTFGGPLTAPQMSTNSLQLVGDLNLSRHIIAGGSTPSRTVGSAVGGGGTASVSGTDAGGTLNINTGSGPSAGCFITVNFVNKYNTTPHVVISPVGSAAAGLQYYVNRTTTSFSVCSVNAPPAGATFAFDYVILG